jgi:hypothetical protein
MSNIGIVLNFILRLLFLGGLIFMATTMIPQKELSLQTRIIIAVVVVIIYSLLDFFARYLKMLKDHLCYWTCGCESQSDSEAPSSTDFQIDLSKI